MERKILTKTQTEIVSRLVETFGIDGNRILFLNPKNPNDPWIPVSQLEIIARQIEGYRDSEVEFDQFIEQTQQFIYKATVIDSQNRRFTRPGVATLGEKPIEGEEFDPHYLAAGRALSAALKSAGFHPCEVDFRRESKAEFSGPNPADVAKERQKQLGVIHEKAKEKGLIITFFDGTLDVTRYKEKLLEKFGKTSAAELDESGRLAAINWLEHYTPDRKIVTEAELATG